MLIRSLNHQKTCLVSKNYVNDVRIQVYAHKFDKFVKLGALKSILKDENSA